MLNRFQTLSDESTVSAWAGNDSDAGESTAVPAAQPDAAPPEVMPEMSLGIALAGMLVMAAAAASLAMLSRWALRWNRSGHALPAANRPMLRVPSALATATLGVSILFAWFAMTFETPDFSEPDQSGSSADVLEPGVAESDDSQDSHSSDVPSQGTDGSDNTTRLDAPVPDPEPTMYDMLFGTLQMNAVLLLILGGIVLAANRQPPATHLTALTSVEAPHSGSSVTADAEQTFADLANPHAMVMTDAASQNPAASPSVSTSEPLCLRTELGFAVEACLAAYAPTIAARLLIVMLMTQFSGEAPPSHPFLEMLDNDGGAMVLLLVALTAVVVAPVVEELQYRVVLLGGLAQVGMTWPALALSSVLFSLAHGMPDGIALIPLALALGYTYLRRRSYITVMLVHFLFNAFNLLVALLGMM
jgi:hypothetical protein